MFQFIDNENDEEDPNQSILDSNQAVGPAQFLTESVILYLKSLNVLFYKSLNIELSKKSSAKY